MKRVIIGFVFCLVLSSACFAAPILGEKSFGESFRKNAVDEYKYADIEWSLDRDRAEIADGEVALKVGVFNVKAPSKITDRVAFYGKVGDRFNLLSPVMLNYSLIYGVGVNVQSLANQLEFDAYVGLESRLPGNVYGDPVLTTPDFQVSGTYHLWEE